MLVKPRFTRASAQDHVIFSLVAEVNKRPLTSYREITHGIYECGHWNFEVYLPYDRSQHSDLKYPQLVDDYNSPNYIGCYGVCDSYQQILKKAPQLQALEDRFFVISMVEVVKADQPSEGGWRWHKWGDYIGDHEIKCEYLYHERGIERVYTYHVYELTADMVSEKDIIPKDVRNHILNSN